MVAGIVVSSAIFANASQAVDGCKVLLCLAGNWKNISQCVPPVEEAFKESALGHPFPSCPSVSPDQADEHFGTISFLPCSSYGDSTVDLGQGQGILQAVHFCGIPAPCTINNYSNGYYTGIASMYGQDPLLKANNGVHICYNKVEAQRPPSSNYVDVYIEGQFYNRTYY